MGTGNKFQLIADSLEALEYELSPKASFPDYEEVQGTIHYIRNFNGALKSVSTHYTPTPSKHRKARQQRFNARQKKKK